PGGTRRHLLDGIVIFHACSSEQAFFARIIFIENWQLRESSKLKKQQRERLLIHSSLFLFCWPSQKDSLSGSGYTQVILG
ncbi:hypothetical protein, partial [Escherichia coli]